MAKLTHEEILAYLEEATILELNDLVKAIEEKFDVTAAAPVAVAAAADAGAAAEPTEVNVTLTEVGGTKVAVIKAVREITGLGLVDAKGLVDKAPSVIKEKVSADEAKEIKEKLENEGYLKKKKQKNTIRKKKRPQFQQYLTKDGIEIDIGKNNLQNDYLTFKYAHRYDMWFHAKDMPGSHVIVKAQDLDEYTIRLAAKIAAYYSKGKNSSSVPVNYTLVKTLKKPAGSKPGKVILDNYKTIYIDPDDEFLQELTKK